MNKRKIHIDEKIYNYSIGRSFVAIWNPYGIRKNIHIADLMGISVSCLEKLRYKSWCWHGGLKPSEIKKYISDNIVKKVLPCDFWV